MTIDEAIKHAEEVAERNEWFDKNCLESIQCKECAKEHRQLAEWLKDYKRLKEQEPCEDAISRQAVLELAIKGILISDNSYTSALNIINGIPSVTPKQKTDVLDKIRAEIEEKYGDYDICEWFEDYDYEENNISEYRPVGDVSDILAIIDKYRAERGGEE